MTDELKEKILGKVEQIEMFAFIQGKTCKTLLKIALEQPKLDKLYQELEEILKEIK